MSALALYPYAEGPLLYERNTYFYTPYHGKPFLDAWLESRHAVLSELPQPAERPIYQECSCPALEAPFFAKDLLYYLISELVLKKNFAQVRLLIDKILQRFEVTKRMHCHYKPDFRPVDSDDFRDLNLYVLFAELMEHSYELNGLLPYLNVLQKCIDTLCSLRHSLNKDQQTKLARTITFEVEKVLSLSRRKDLTAKNQIQNEEYGKRSHLES